jgi:hypothetical protein
MCARIVIKTTSFVVSIVLVLLLADLVLFAVTTHDGPSMVPVQAEEGDIVWWNRHVGTTPRVDLIQVPPPEAFSGSPGNWLRKDGGHGGDGVAVTPLALHKGLAAYRVEGAGALSGFVRGRVLASEDHCAYRVGVALPFVMLERSHLALQGQPPPPLSEDWQRNLLPAGLLGNATILFLLIGMPFLYSDFVSLTRIWRRRCAGCGHMLLESQSRCPECGAVRRRL